ncbi:MAG: hypothetical protein CML29_05770 [Rhizobiales bacterium]|nr:hypothetical protein [Hyphomicrobiales bacterium]
MRNAQPARTSRRPDLVIFDLDGCLIDSEITSLGSLHAEMQALGITDVTVEDLRDRFLGVSLRNVCDFISEQLGRPCPDDFADRFHARLFAAFETELVRIEPMVELVDALIASGTEVAIGTGGSIERMGMALRCAGLESRFSGRGFSGDQVARGKPAPDLFLFAASELGFRPENCAVVEDSPHGIKGATAAGMTSFGFVGGSHLEGIREVQQKRLLAAGAALITADPADIRRFMLDDQPVTE